MVTPALVLKVVASTKTSVWEILSAFATIANLKKPVASTSVVVTKEIFLLLNARHIAVGLVVSAGA